MPKEDILEFVDWNFEDVPDSEIRACLIWELGRECEDFFLAEFTAELREMAGESRYDKELRKRIENTPEERRRARRELKNGTFDLDLHYERLFKSHFAYNDFYSQVMRYARPWSASWMDISQEARDSAVKQLEGHPSFPPIRHARLGELEELWNANGAEILKYTAQKEHPPYDDTLDALRVEESKLVESKNDERDPQLREIHVAFTVNFSLHSNAEILAVFQEWLQESRTCPEPPRRGKKTNDDRAALDALGIMRVLNRMSFSHNDFPAKLKRRGERACYKARHIALRRYHENFPFLDASSYPACWKTAPKSRRF
jgi:hypothetical protein